MDSLPRIVITAVVTFLAVLVVWLVLARSIRAFLRGLGFSCPCPVWAGWVLELRPGRWFRRGIVREIAVRPGETVLEIGTGVGTFTASLARQAGPRGMLVALDSQRGMVDRVVARMRREGSGNTAPVVADARHLPLAAGTIDRVVLVCVLGELVEPNRCLREIHRVLQPAGILSITEEVLDPDYQRPSRVRSLLSQTGFHSGKQAGKPWLYTLWGRKNA